MHRTRLLLALPLVAVIGLAACGDDSGKGDSGSTSVEGPMWVLNASEAASGQVEGPQATLTLDNGAARGSNGCNSFTGPYTLDGSNLTFGTLATTQMACEGPAADLEKTVMAGLQATKSYSVSNGSLELKDGSGKTLLTYTEAKAGDLQADWDIIAYLNVEKTAFQSALADTNPTISFGTDDQLSGTTGCNNFTGTYAVEGENVTTSGVASTKKACETPEGIVAQEAGILAAVGASATWTTTSTGVDIYDADGMRVLQLAKKS